MELQTAYTVDQKRDWSDGGKNACEADRNLIKYALPILSLIQ